MIERILRALSRNPVQEIRDRLGPQLREADEALDERKRHISRMEALVLLREQPITEQPS